MPQFVRDVQEIRQRAMRKIENGAVTEAYGVDKEQAIQILNEALATEIVCVLRYMHHYFMATGVHGKSVADEFKEHADAEREHADLLAERIQQLGGKPDFNPKNLLQRSVSQYVEGETLADMIREDLIAERMVIEVYIDMIRFFGNNDPTTRVILEKLLSDEEEHADDLASLLYIVDPHTGEEVGEDPGTRPLQMHDGQARGEHSERSKKNQANDDRRRRANGGFGQREDDHTAELHPEDTELGRAAAVPPRQESPEKKRMGQANSERGNGGNRPENRQSGQRKPDRNATPPAHQPGGRGRPMNRRQQEMNANIEATDVAERANAGAQGGATRAVRVTRPNRKKRAA